MKLLLLFLCFALVGCGAQVTAVKAGATTDGTTYGGYGEVDLGYKK